jgi:hypothetical protein
MINIWSLIDSIPFPAIGMGAFFTLYVGSFIIGCYCLLVPSNRDREFNNERVKRSTTMGRFGGRR